MEILGAGYTSKAFWGICSGRSKDGKERGVGAREIRPPQYKYFAKYEPAFLAEKYKEW
jgi:hypothetical protein